MNIDIIGTGNVGTHLYRALKGKANVKSIPARTFEGLRSESEIYIVCVSDFAIPEIVNTLSGMIEPNGIIAHTSGTTPLSAISDIYPNTGVLYPMQTFSKDVELNYGDIPFFIEGSDNRVLSELRNAAALISENITVADSEARRDLHIASVLSCNFVNHLWTLAYDYLKSKGISFDSMIPLIKETVRKISRVSPPNAQTGPAVRCDIKTISDHLDTLSSDERLSELYKIMSESIIARHHNNH